MKTKNKQNSKEYWSQRLLEVERELVGESKNKIQTEVSSSKPMINSYNLNFTKNKPSLNKISNSKLLSPDIKNMDKSYSRKSASAPNSFIKSLLLVLLFFSLIFSFYLLDIGGFL